MLNQEQQIFEQIKKANHVLITFNKTWNGDAVAAGLAMFLFLKKLEKDVEIVAEKLDNGKLYSFLPGYGKIQHSLDNLRKFIISLDITNAKVGQIKYTVEENILNFIISPQDGFFTQDDITSRSGGFKYDLIIALDTPDLESLGKIYDNDTEFFYQVPLINIDHHSGNEEFGQINKVELTAVATSEILFSLLSNYSRDSIDEDIATCLLAGMISKTRSFKTQNITPHALSVASQLVSMGARREEIVNYLYRSRSLNVLKLWGRVLARLTSSLNDQLVWSVLTSFDFEKTETGENDLSEVIDELIVNIPEAKVVVIVYEIPGAEHETQNEFEIKTKKQPIEPLSVATSTQPALSSTDSSTDSAKQGGGRGEQAEKPASKALIYSMKNINSLNLVKGWKPVGTKSMAKITIPKPLSEAEKDVIDVIKEKLSRLPM